MWGLFDAYKSEGFWIWIIQSTIAKLIDSPKFELENADIPHADLARTKVHFITNFIIPNKSIA